MDPRVLSTVYIYTVYLTGSSTTLLVGLDQYELLCSLSFKFGVAGVVAHTAQQKPVSFVFFFSLPPSPLPERMNPKSSVAKTAKASSSTTRSDRGAALPSAAAAAAPLAKNVDRRSNSHGIIFYLHRPIGAPAGTVRLSLEDDPAAIGRTSSKSSSSTTTKRATGARRGSYWAVPHPWKDFQVVWQQHEYNDSSTRHSAEHLELSGNPGAWGRLTVDEWADCCKIMSGNASLPRRGALPGSEAQPTLQTPLALKPRFQQQPVVLPPPKIARLRSVRFLDGCPTPEQRQLLLRHVNPHRLEICTDCDEGSGVRQTLEPILTRRNLHDNCIVRMRDLILHGPVLDVDDCRDVARLMEASQQLPLPTPGATQSDGIVRNSGGGLRRLTLRSVTFASREAWELLLEAMKSSLSMEGVTWDHINCFDDCGSEVQQGNERTGGVPPLVRLDRDDDSVMKQLKDELAQLHAFNALHRAACTAVRSHHRLHRQSNQRDDETRVRQNSLDVVDSAIEVLRQWYLSSTPAAVAVASSSRQHPHPGTMPAPPQTRSVANDLASPVSAKTLTMSDVVRRSRLLSSCS
jgi:hypothetical protein